MRYDRRRFLKYGVGGAVGVLALGTGGWWEINRHRNLFEVRGASTMMKTIVSVTVLTEDPAYGRKAIETALRRMETTASLLSRFEPNGPVGVLNRTGRVDGPPSALLDVLHRARRYSEISDGAFDVTVLPVLEYYYGLPRPVALDRLDRRAVAQRDRRVGYRALRFHEARVWFERPGMSVTLDGIAKGYVVDQGIKTLQRHGIRDAIINAGGDVRAINGSDARPPWKIGIRDPHDPRRLCAVVPLRNGALATSGNYEIYFSADRRLFHIIDPHTGYSPDSYSSVTVLAEHSVEADALGVTLYSLSLPRIRDLMRHEGKDWFMVSWDGRQRWRSPGFPLLQGTAQVV